MNINNIFIWIGNPNNCLRLYIFIWIGNPNNIFIYLGQKMSQYLSISVNINQYTVLRTCLRGRSRPCQLRDHLPPASCKKATCLLGEETGKK